MSFSNHIKTVLLLGLLTGILLGIGLFFGGKNGLAIMIVFSVLLNFGTYWFSDRIVLAMYSAKQVSQSDNPKLHKIVDEVCSLAKVPKPKVYVVPGDAANAFATGRGPGNAAVACTEGITKLLSDDELKGVIAHEISHVKNRDVLIATIAATIAGVISYLAYMMQWFSIFGGSDDDNGGNMLSAIAFSILTPIIALLIQLAISRSREYLADETAARILRNPQGLVSALEKLDAEASKKPLKTASAATSTASLFIVNPLRGGGMLTLLSTHPPLKDRVRKLRMMRV